MFTQFWLYVSHAGLTAQSLCLFAPLAVNKQAPVQPPTALTRHSGPFGYFTQVLLLFLLSFSKVHFPPVRSQHGRETDYIISPSVRSESGATLAVYSSRAPWGLSHFCHVTVSPSVSSQNTATATEKSRRTYCGLSRTVMV